MVDVEGRAHRNCRRKIIWLSMVEHEEFGGELSNIEYISMHVKVMSLNDDFFLGGGGSFGIPEAALVKEWKSAQRGNKTSAPKEVLKASVLSLNVAWIKILGNCYYVFFHTPGSVYWRKVKKFLWKQNLYGNLDCTSKHIPCLT